MIYPFLSKQNFRLRKFLINNRVYVAKYWPKLAAPPKLTNFTERQLLNNLLALPIDQRYSTNEIQYVLNLIKTHFNVLQ
jgi:hypothetical protein